MKTLIYILLTILLVGHPGSGVKIETEALIEPKPESRIELKPEYIKEASIQEERDIVIDLTNQERIKAGVAPLLKSLQLTTSATAKACHLRDNDYWAHIAPDGTTPWDFFDEAGYVYLYAGENLCKYYDEARCMKAWMISEKHRDNILDSKFKEIGTGKCGVYTVQHFGLSN